MASLAVDAFRVITHITTIYLLGICTIAFIAPHIDPLVNPEELIIQALSSTYTSIAELYTPVLVGITIMALFTLHMYFIMDVVYSFGKQKDVDLAAHMDRNIPGPTVTKPSTTVAAANSTELLKTTENRKPKSLYLHLFVISLLSLLATFARLYYEQTYIRPAGKAHNPTIPQQFRTIAWDQIWYLKIVAFVVAVLFWLLLYKVGLTIVLLVLILLRWSVRKCFCCGCSRRASAVTTLAETDIEIGKAEEGSAQFVSHSDSAKTGDDQKESSGQESKTIE